VGAGAAVVVVAAAVVGGAVVVGGLVVVVGLGALVVCAALVAGRVAGGVLAEVRAVVGAGVRSRRVELVVLDRRTVVGGGASPPPPAATATVVGTGHGRSRQPDGGPDRPKA